MIFLISIVSFISGFLLSPFISVKTIFGLGKCSGYCSGLIKGSTMFRRKMKDTQQKIKEASEKENKSE